MYVFVVANFLVIPLLALAHPDWVTSSQHVVIAGHRGGRDSTAVLLIIAIVGTTVAPWQLFFQQSNIIDKRITPRWINYERAGHRDRRVRRRDRRGRADLRVRVRLRRHRVLRPFHQRGHGRDTLGQQLGLGRGRDLRDRAAERLADRRGGGDAVDLLRVRRRLRRQPLAHRSRSTPSSSTRSSLCGDGRRRRSC